MSSLAAANVFTGQIFQRTRAATGLAGLLLLVGLGTTSGTPAAELSAVAAAAASIQADDVRGHTDTLADDSFEGREAGTRGGRATTTYVMKKLEALGLQPAGDNGGYFQSFGGYRNVLAVVAGADGRLKDEVVVIGAHLDHVGFGSKRNSLNPGFIHNGADDNASGTAALLEVAEALSKLPAPPRRTILLAFWDAEEKGLLGSKHWIAHPTLPLEHVKFNINADMVGRMEDDKVIVYGTRTAAGLRRLVTQQNELTELNVSYVWSIDRNSDHYTFVKEKIPVLMLHTGKHKDYHQPGDDAHKLNVDGITRIAQLVFRVTCDLADREELPKWRDGGVWESGSHRKRYETPSAPPAPRLGITWDLEKPDDLPGLPVNQVSSGSPAFLAGLKAKDRILKFDGHEIQTGEDLRRRVLAAPKDVQIVIRREGTELPLSLNARLNGKPVRVGINWRENTAEPGAVTIVRVAEGSPAADAGVQTLDRIYAVGGRDFADSDEFQRRIAAIDGPIDLLLDRDGRLLNVRVTPP